MVKKKKRFKDFEEALIFLCIFECAKNIEEIERKYLQRNTK
jgi:hypothetical protein